MRRLMNRLTSKAANTDAVVAMASDSVTLARCAVLTDVALIEDAPFHAEVAASRVHRWTRGDWQLLPILLRSLVQPWRYPLGAVNRWKILDNLRRSVVSPVCLALLLMSLAGLPAVEPSAL